MHNCVGFPSGTVANSHPTYTSYNATAVTTTITRPNIIIITSNKTDRLRLLIIQILKEMVKYQLIR